jgi:hypothetical protein
MGSSIAPSVGCGPPTRRGFPDACLPNGITPQGRVTIRGVVRPQFGPSSLRQLRETADLDHGGICTPAVRSPPRSISSTTSATGLRMDGSAWLYLRPFMVCTLGVRSEVPACRGDDVRRGCRSVRRTSTKTLGASYRLRRADLSM